MPPTWHIHRHPDPHVLSGYASSYLADDCCLITSARLRRLRLAETRKLFASRTQTNFGDRAYSAAGPRVWNYLPTDLRQLDLSYSHFRLSLKTFLFDKIDNSAAWIWDLTALWKFSNTHSAWSETRSRPQRVRDRKVDSERAKKWGPGHLRRSKGEARRAEPTFRMCFCATAPKEAIGEAHRAEPTSPFLVASDQKRQILAPVVSP